jgi:penicillin-binding protein 1A
MHFFRGLLVAVGVGIVLTVVGVAMVYAYYARDLPDHQQLATYEPPLATRVYAGNGRLLAEYANEKRAFVPIDQIPEIVVQAFVSAEDKKFYSHSGFDLAGIARAAITNLANLGSDRRPVGASTIPQQVAKNFLLDNQVSIARKIREAILAVRMSRTFSKDRILELYLNEIYLGAGTYGVAAAALGYFDKSLSELTLAEAAFLAALPKAPSRYDPARHPEAARARRDWVIGRMLEDGHIGAVEAQAAVDTPLATRGGRTGETVAAQFFAEDIRRELAARYGEKTLYEGGLVVHATIDTSLQEIADRMLRAGLEEYDRRHGWRGPVAKLSADRNIPWPERLASIAPPAGIGDRQLALVLRADAREAMIGFADGHTGRLPFEHVSWARPWLPNQRVGPPPKAVSDVLKNFDVILVEPVGKGVYALRQVPAVDGAVVALDPHTGRVLAIAGGYTYDRSQFNRATQALRQPGSAFKPIVYLAAFEAGFTPASIVLDAPISYEQGPGLPNWRPSNYSDRFYGPTTLRVGLEQSRNVMTVRLADRVGMKQVADAAQRLGVFDDMPPYLAYALGAGETTLLRLTAAYATLVNGGHGITPSLIDRIQNRYGVTIYRHDDRPCPECSAPEWAGQPVPELPDMRPVVTDPHSAYQIVSLMEGVVQRGTGQKVKSVGKPLAGKTGTSNDAKDTWFIGFSPDLAVGVFVGFDEPASLGPNETGGAVAAPIFRDIMAEALADTPAIPFRIPAGIRLVRVDAGNGRPAGAQAGGVILEAFKPGTVPGDEDGPNARGSDSAVAPAAGTGGLY